MFIVHGGAEGGPQTDSWGHLYQLEVYFILFYFTLFNLTLFY